MAEPSNALDVAQKENMEFEKASNVNVSNFVSVTLTGEDNYKIWSAQMLCLMRSQNMSGLILNSDHWKMGRNITIIEKYDNLVKGWIFGSLDERVLKLVTDSLPNYDAADRRGRHVWWKLHEYYGREEYQWYRPTDAATDLVRIRVPEHNDDNTELKKKLRDVTLEGRWWKAKSILDNHKDAATEVISTNDNTMLHLAVAKGNNYFLEKLLNFIPDDEKIEKKNSDGHTALHIAVMVDNKYAAELLVKKRKELLEIEGPLIFAFFEAKPNTFVYLVEAAEKAQIDLLQLNKSDPEKVALGCHICEKTLYMKQYDLASKLLTAFPDMASTFDSVLLAITINFPNEIGFGEALLYPSLDNIFPKIVKRCSLLVNMSEFLYTKAEEIIWAMRSYRNTYYGWLVQSELIIVVSLSILYPTYQLVCLFIMLLLLPFSSLYFLLWNILAIFVFPIKHLEKKQKEYKEAKQILKFICHQFSNSRSSGHDISFYRRSILAAARSDAFEVVSWILKQDPMAIGCKNENGHNVIQLAIVSRSKKVYNVIRPFVERTESYKSSQDSTKNNLLHLAGRLAPSTVLSHTRGAALQLQRELQWFEEVKKLISPTEHLTENSYKETPEMVFTREHAHLVKEGEQWMKTTAESCSITAALIVTIVFAAAITVPGGSNQETGIPLFEKQTAFIIFAVCDAISLFTAATSLLVFLSILTTRFAERDFLVSLPRRLIIGLCSLFISTAAMMVAFSAILFLVFCDQTPWMLAPIGGLACLPNLAIVTLQLPLVVDLFLSTYFPLFGKQMSD